MFGSIRNLLSAFGTQNIEVYEWAAKDVRKPRLPNGPVWDNLATSRSTLHFTGWDLAHAVVKADYLVERNYLLPGLGLLLQLDQIISFRAGSNMRLIAGSPATLNDFTKSSLTGRLGQGLSLLFAQQRGYQFAGHLASDPAVISHLASGNAKTDRAADFLFETHSSQRMILESKASFSEPDNDPSKIKSKLKSALTSQVDYWISKITPKASKGYAVYSCLREVGNPTPSALVFVDPPGETGPNPIDLPETWVRQRNFSAWMRVMGFDAAAAGMISGRRDGIAPTPVSVLTIEGRDFAISPLMVGPEPGHLLCAGLDMDVMLAIIGYLKGDDASLMTLESIVPRDGGKRQLGDQPWSIFPDGSFFGLVRLADPNMSLKPFKP
ncbi:hypothetical protein MTR62_13500 [Novosphingobium sp. 1949]|uniref:Uncharacterized protein n=1 Tax=Novosphingobium organovorum TaxID=2930092 RepID=A0ABT0BF76_9SPHN|nr:hypothetical protein [Novosphingobium organovorum]MCJ2183697.1 hypothetical protein [Novosphingobium organovorum]